MLASPERSFLLLGALAALVFSFLTPPFQVPDESTHLFRSFQISEGQLLVIRKSQTSAGVLIPESLMQTKQAWGQDIPFHPEVRLDLERAWPSLGWSLEPERRRYKDIRGAASYSPVPYLPQALGILVGRLVRAPPIALLYLARILNAAAALALCVWALRRLPCGRWPVFLMLLSPIFCFLRSSASPDAVTYSLAFANIASSLAIAFAPVLPDRRLAAAYVVSALLLFLSKHAYLTVPLALAVGLANPVVKGRVVRLLLAAYLPGAFLVVAWLVFVADVTVPVIPGSDPFAQLRFVLADPLRYAELLAGYLWATGPIHLAGLVGRLGWVDTPLPVWLVIGYWLALAAVTVLASEPRRPTSVQRLVLLACAGGGCLLVVTLVYFLAPVGAGHIQGVQSRYFVPLLPLAGFAALGLRPSAAAQRNAPVLCTGVAGVSLLVTFATLVDRYWVALG